jgi:nitrogen fixation protein NifU and related proteins
MSLADFQALVLARNRVRGFFGECLPADLRVTHRARGANPLCGDRLEVIVHIDQTGFIVGARFFGEMSAITAAAADILCERLERQGHSEALTLLGHAQMLLSSSAMQPHTLGDFAAFAVLRDYPARLKTALLPIASFQAALRGEADVDFSSEP